MLTTGCAKKSHHGAGGLSWTEESDLDAYADASVYEYDPDFNEGDYEELYAGYASLGDDWEEDIYLYFDTSSIPPEAIVVSVELRLYIAYCWNSTGMVFSLEEVDDEWDEMEITWNTAPQTSYVTQFACPPQKSETGEYDGWFTVTDSRLTALVQTWVSGDAPNNGLAIMPVWQSAPTDDEIYVTSLDGGTAPELVIYYYIP
jgi:hypothetical protein